MSQTWGIFVKYFYVLNLFIEQKISVNEIALQFHVALIIFIIALHCFQFQNRILCNFSKWSALMDECSPWREVWNAFSLFLMSHLSYYRLWHIKNKGVQQLHTLSQNSEAIDVWKIACHPPSRHMVAYNDYSF